MPRIGPDFLHRPIESVKFAQLEGAFFWLLEGIAFLAPRRLREFKWRAAEECIDFDGSLKTTPLGTVERSLFGAERFRAFEHAQPDLPVRAVLSAPLIFVTSLDLPAAARGSLNKTVALRMDDISPIPAGDAQFAIGKVEITSPDRISAKIAIVRKSTLENVGRALKGRIIASIVAEAEGGEQIYAFKKTRAGGASALAWMGTAAVLWLAVFALLAAADFRAARQLKALAAYETSLQADIKALRADRSLMAELDNVSPMSASGGSVTGLATAFAARLPARSVFDKIAFEGGQIRIDGMAPALTSPPTAEFDVHFSRSELPGFDRFQARIPAGALKEDAS